MKKLLEKYSELIEGYDYEGRNFYNGEEWMSTKLEDIFTYYYVEYDVKSKKFFGKGIVPYSAFEFVKEYTKDYLENKKTNKHFQIEYNNLKKEYWTIKPITKREYEK